jgi:hypothetical protein
MQMGISTENPAKLSSDVVMLYGPFGGIAMCGFSL